MTGLPLLRFVLLAALAAAPLAAKETHPGQRALLRELAEETGADRETRAHWKALLDGAQYQQSIINAISKPAEATKPWRDYRPIFVTEQRLRDGLKFWKENRALLDRVSNDTGVPAEIIVAIIGVETSYGRITGKYKVIDALTTLALYYPPRAPFFRGELKQFLRLPGERFPISAAEVTGSYAGAMGWGQFMPTSYAKWARDDDGDGRIDLWNSRGDIIASVANYFVAHGWQKGQPVAGRAIAREGAELPEIRATETLHTLQSLRERGFVPTIDGLPPELPSTLLVLEGSAGTEHWITHQNFYVISRYNRSPMYSMAVHQLSLQLAAGITEPAKP
jgi:membrane-bound lytic murein transglycosylase B